MKSAKPLCQAILLASILALAPLASAHASPWRAVGDLPSVEKPGLLAWLPEALSGLWAMVWGDEGCSIDPDGHCVVNPVIPDDPDEGVSIDPNGGQ